MVTGIALGVLVGFLAGAAFIVCVWAASRGEVLKAATTIVAIPASCFSGGWLTTLFNEDEVLSAYVAALSVTTVVVGSWTLLKLIVRVTNELSVEP